MEKKVYSLKECRELLNMVVTSINCQEQNIFRKAMKAYCKANCKRDYGFNHCNDFPCEALERFGKVMEE